MITRLEGVLIEKTAPRVVLDVHGVGYELELPMSSYYDLPDTGATLCLKTHLVVREDAHLLFGFITEAERAIFRELIKVSGIGAKVALAILSSLSVEAFVQIIRSKDTASLTRVPGIGKKTAERLTLELSDRFGASAPASSTSVALAASGLPGGTARSTRGDAVQALATLGYKPADAELMIRQVFVEGMATEELIRLALKKSLAR